MNFAVKPGELTSAADNFKVMAAGFDGASSYCEQWVRVSPAAGRMGEQIRDGVDHARGVLTAAYGQQGLLPAFLSGTDVVLRRLDRDYAGLDHDVAAAFDAKLPTPANNRSTYGLSPDDEDAGVSPADLSGELTAPGTGFEGYDQYRAVVEGIGYLADLTWVVDGVTWVAAKLGIDTGSRAQILQDLQDFYNGQWDELGRTGEAVGRLAGFVDRVQDEEAATVLALAETWSGNAATSAYVTIGRFDDALGGHENSLYALQGDIRNLAYGLRYLTDFLIDAFDAAAGMAAEVLADPAESVLKLGKYANAVSRWVTIVVLAIDSLFALVGGFALVASALSEPDVSVDAASVPPAPSIDVNGPGR